LQGTIPVALSSACLVSLETPCPGLAPREGVRIVRPHLPEVFVEFGWKGHNLLDACSLLVFLPGETLYEELLGHVLALIGLNHIGAVQRVETVHTHHSGLHPFLHHLVFPEVEHLTALGVEEFLRLGKQFLETLLAPVFAGTLLVEVEPHALDLVVHVAEGLDPAIPLSADSELLVLGLLNQIHHHGVAVQFSVFIQMFIARVFVFGFFEDFDGRVELQVDLLGPVDSGGPPGYDVTLDFERIDVLSDFCDVFGLHVVCAVALLVSPPAPQPRP